MQITGLVVDAKTRTPLEAVRVVISREGGGDEIASLATGADGRFLFDDDLNEYLGQQLAFTAEQDGYNRSREVQMATRGLTVTLRMARRDVISDGWLKRLLARLAGLPRAAWIGLAALPLLALLILGVSALWQPDPGPQCNFGAIRAAAQAGDAPQLRRIATACEREGNGALRFAAIEQCAMQSDATCLLTMGRWYDPQMASEPTPFTRRSAEIAIQYYRRAQNQGVSEARPLLDALCRSLQQSGAEEGSRC